MTHDNTSDPEDGPAAMRGHGGARRGAGRKPRGFKWPTATKLFHSAQARKLDAQARIAEIDVAEMEVKYVSRVAVRDACATLHSILTHGMRNIPR